MKTTVPVKLALNIVLHSKLRSWLTIIGIVIGVAAVVALVSMGEGLQQSVSSRLQGLGADIITITVGGWRAERMFGGGEMRAPPQMMGRTTTQSSETKPLTKNDIQLLKTIENVEAIQGTISGRTELIYLGEKATIQAQGVDPIAWKQMTLAELESGRLLESSDLNGVVIGNRIANGTFKQPLQLNMILSVEGKNFKIVGILKENGENDNEIFMPIRLATEILDKEDEFDSIMIKASDVEAVDKIIEDADETLMLFRRVTEKNKDFSINSAKAMQERVTEITGSVTLFLAAIAAVSLLVGAVGIANTMFTTVLEKTKEIGIMKAIGAKNADIMIIFLLYAIIVGAIGGIIGLAVGSAASILMPQTGIMMGMGRPGEMATAISPKLLAYALLIAIGVAIAAGVIPAYRASKLKPMEALRYE